MENINNNKDISKDEYDEIISIRRGVDIILRSGVVQNNLGSRNSLGKALNEISKINPSKYRITISNNDMSSTIDNVDNSYNVIKILEEDNALFIIYIDIDDGLTKIYVNPYDLLYSYQIINSEIASRAIDNMLNSWEKEIDILKKISNNK